MTRLAATNLKVSYGDQLRLAVPRIDFPTGGLVGLIGANGAGKTTLLRALAGLVPVQGTVQLANTRLSELPSRSRARQLAVGSLPGCV